MSKAIFRNAASRSAGVRRAQRGASSYGPNPWQQAHWDWRAAGNFIGGGAGAGLIVATAMSPAQGLARTLLLLAGLALVGLGLSCVWLEIGRPWRALNVFLQPRRSWMSREAIVGTLLLPTGAAAALLSPQIAPAAAVLALAFVYCQSRMVMAARGIPAWRQPLVSPLIVLTGLTEGVGLWLLATPLHGAGAGMAMPLGLLVLLRILVWSAYRRRVGASAAPAALRALDGAGRWLLWGGTVLPVLLLDLVGFLGVSGVAASLLLALAGAAAALPGSWFKFVLVTRAGFNQGFAIPHLPVRGVPQPTAQKGAS